MDDNLPIIIRKDTPLFLSNTTFSYNSRIGDHCEMLLKLMTRLHEKNLSFSENAVEEINTISAKVREILVLINRHITSRKQDIMIEAKSLENVIDRMRHNLRKSHIKRLNEGGCDVASGLVFLDMLSSFEKIGDHAYNIAESISGIRP